MKSATAEKLPSEMTITELRKYLKGAGVAYSGNDRKDALVDKARGVRYGTTPVDADDLGEGELSLSELRETDEASGAVPAAIEVVDAASRAARNKAAREEAQTLKEWQAQPAGPTGDRPPTPNLDAINAQPSTTKAKGSKAPKVPKSFLAYNGTDVPEGRGLSYVAWAFTRGIASEDSLRLSLAELKVLLAKAGIDDPEHTAWECKLPNGVTITATRPAAS